MKGKGSILILFTGCCAKHVDQRRISVRGKENGGKIIVDWEIKLVLQGSPRSPDIHDMSECHRLYDLGRHTEQP